MSRSACVKDKGAISLSVHVISFTYEKLNEGCAEMGLHHLNLGEEIQRDRDLERQTEIQTDRETDTRL